MDKITPELLRGITDKFYVEFNRLNSSSENQEEKDNLPLFKKILEEEWDDVKYAMLVAAHKGCLHLNIGTDLPCLLKVKQMLETNKKLYRPYFCKFIKEKGYKPLFINSGPCMDSLDCDLRDLYISWSA